MAKFIYRMQNILSLYMKLEDEAKIKLALANNQLRQEEERLESIFLDIAQYEDSIRDFKNKKLDVLELKRCNDAIVVKKMEADNQRKKIQVAQKNVDREMKNLTDIMIDRKTQETLKDREFEEFVREVNEEEKKEVDQIISYQYNGTEEGDL